MLYLCVFLQFDGITKLLDCRAVQQSFWWIACSVKIDHFLFRIKLYTVSNYLFLFIEWPTLCDFINSSVSLCKNSKKEAFQDCHIIHYVSSNLCSTWDIDINKSEHNNVVGLNNINNCNKMVDVYLVLGTLHSWKLLLNILLFKIHLYNLHCT